MPAKPVIRGLYAVTPDLADTATLVAKTEQALKGGARLLQYRNKQADKGLKLEQATELARLCRGSDCLFIVNDSVEVAMSIGAPGVHLGREDGDLAAARRLLGPDVVLGASCYGQIEAAERARDAGVDYVAFGAAYASPTKPGNKRAPLELYREARRIGLPVVAIGGITLDNARPLVDAGVDALAVITALYNAPDITAAARGFAAFYPD
jgi:thiamine-phosphate pyrophosphorylase